MKTYGQEKLNDAEADDSQLFKMFSNAGDLKCHQN